MSKEFLGVISREQAPCWAPLGRLNYLANCDQPRIAAAASYRVGFRLVSSVLSGCDGASLASRFGGKFKG